MATELLRPVVALAAWTLIMLIWGVALRVASGKDVDSAVGKRMVEAGAVLPTRSQFKIDNYNHLLEQPTIFYVIAVVLTLCGEVSAGNIALCWTYVGLRVLHSIIHATTNPVMPRFVIFALGTIVLVWLTIVAALRVF